MTHTHTYTHTCGNAACLQHISLRSVLMRKARTLLVPPWHGVRCVIIDRTCWAGKNSAQCWIRCPNLGQGPYSTFFLHFTNRIVAITIVVAITMQKGGCHVCVCVCVCVHVCSHMCVCHRCSGPGRACTSPTSVSQYRLLGLPDPCTGEGQRHDIYLQSLSINAATVSYFITCTYNTHAVVQSQT